MSSLAGVLSRREPDASSAVRHMLRAAPHRGEVHDVLRLGACVLGISYALDGFRGPAGSHGGSRPDDASLVCNQGMAAAFAGVLDNLDELGRELKEAGSPPVAEAAAAVLAVFRAWGIAGLGRLRGQFACIVTDGIKLWGWRDQVGFGPLFFREDAKGVWLASEAKQVVAGAGITAEPDLEVLERIYFYDIDPSRTSAIRGVSRLNKALVLEADEESVSQRCYFDPSGLVESARLTDDEVATRFAELMSQAVSRVLTGRDTVAMSGGVDSPAVAAFAAPVHLARYGRRLAALSEVYPDYPSADERPWIEMAARHLGLELHTFQPSPEGRRGLDDWTRLLDGPVPGWLPNDDAEYYRRAAALGFRTILMGTLAESVMAQSAHLPAHYLWHGRIGPLARYLRHRHAAGASFEMLLRELAGAVAPTRLHLARARRRPIFLGAEIPRWLEPERMQRVLGRFGAPPWDRWRRAQASEFVGVPSLIMEGQGLLQEREGVRCRHPWADLDLWLFFLSLPAEQKYPEAGRKGLVRRLLRGRLPDAILDRKSKTVFNEWALRTIDRVEFRRWLVDPPYRLPGVRYKELATRIDATDVSLYEFFRMHDLAFVHAFLAQW